MASLEGPGIRSPFDVGITIMTSSRQVAKRRVSFVCRPFRHVGCARWAREPDAGLSSEELCSAFGYSIKADAY
jgi:hypothetical protein